MSSNRLVKSQLLRKLSDLKKSTNYPVRPPTNPAILYVQNVLKPDSLNWDKPHRRPTNLNSTVKHAVRAWPSMDPKIKGLKQLFTFVGLIGWIPGLFKKDAEDLLEKYKSAERDWLTINGDSDAAKEILQIQQQIVEL